MPTPLNNISANQRDPEYRNNPINLDWLLKHDLNDPQSIPHNELVGAEIDHLALFEYAFCVAEKHGNALATLDPGEDLEAAMLEYVRQPREMGIDGVQDVYQNGNVKYKTGMPIRFCEHQFWYKYLREALSRLREHAYRMQGLIGDGPGQIPYASMLSRQEYVLHKQGKVNFSAMMKAFIRQRGVQPDSSGETRCLCESLRLLRADN